MPDLATGAVVFVTGGASGIGRAAAQQFSAEGAAHVVVADLDIDGAEDTVASLAGPGSSIELDVTDDTAVAVAIDALVAEHGRLDIAFNNAGVNDAPRAFHDLDAASWDRMIRVNLSRCFVCMKHELRHMAAAGSGAIVNTSSGAGVVAAPGLRTHRSEARRRRSHESGGAGVRAAGHPGQCGAAGLDRHHDAAVVHRRR